MSRPTDKQRLLTDVLTDDAEFREALFSETMRLARRRRRLGVVRQAVCAVAVLALVATVLWRTPQTRIANIPDSLPQPIANYEMIRTAPLAVSSLVTTRPLADERMVASAVSVQTVETLMARFREIGDDDLLALIAPRVAALVRHAPHSAELIVLDPLDDAYSPPN